ncbi:hypothetical protein EH61_18750 [Escherichia coli]|nr:hypothetical protein EH61_18750 [Escherichia coli]
MTHQELKVMLLKIQHSGLLMKLRARTRNPVTRLSGIMVMALKKWCLILVYQVQIYQLTG